MVCFPQSLFPSHHHHQLVAFLVSGSDQFRLSSFDFVMLVSYSGFFPALEHYAKLVVSTIKEITILVDSLPSIESTVERQVFDQFTISTYFPPAFHGGRNHFFFEFLILFFFSCW